MRCRVKYCVQWWKNDASSIVKWGYQDNFKHVYLFIYLFCEKILRAQKHSQANINQQNKIKQTLNNKGNNFLCAQTSKMVKVACFAFWCFLCARNLFVKINTQAWNCLDNLISLYYWRVLLLTCLSRIYLYTLIFICDHLWFFKSLWK